MDKPTIIPLKIVVTGTFSSGKTQFIQAISEIKVVKTERKRPKDIQQPSYNPTIAMDLGRVTVNETIVLYLFGTPSARRFESEWEFLSSTGGLLGYITLIDSSQPSKFRETKHILDVFRNFDDVPYVVAANKQDLPDAWSVQDMQIALKLKEPVIPCCAHDVASVKHVLLTLLERVLARIDEEEVET